MCVSRVGEDSLLRLNKARRHNCDDAHKPLAPSEREGPIERDEY